MAYANTLTALADPTRRRVFERLRSGPASVGDLAAELPVSRPAVSQHLKALKMAGLVNDKPDGARRVYYIDPEGLGELRSLNRPRGGATPSQVRRLGHRTGSRRPTGDATAAEF